MIFFVNDPIAMHWKIQISKRTVSFDSVLVTTKKLMKKDTGGMDIWRTSCRGIGTNDCLCKNFLLLSFSCLPFFGPLISASPSNFFLQIQNKRLSSLQWCQTGQRRSNEFFLEHLFSANLALLGLDVPGPKIKQEESACYTLGTCHSPTYGT